MKTEFAMNEREDPVRIRLLREYYRMRDDYVMICRRNREDPLDLDIMTVMAKGLSHEDRTALVRMILRLTRLEKEFKGEIRYPLFPETVMEIESTGFAVPKRRKSDVRH